MLQKKTKLFGQPNRREVGDCQLNSFIKQKIMMDETLLKIVVEKKKSSGKSGTFFLGRSASGIRKDYFRKSVTTSSLSRMNTILFTKE